jgi:hypothetical protein
MRRDQIPYDTMRGDQIPYDTMRGDRPSHALNPAERTLSHYLRGLIDGHES